jgi:hypothetical protein
MNCKESRKDGNMATKIKLQKLLQEVAGYAQITNRRPPPRPPLLFLMQLRTQHAPASLPKRRLIIETDIKEFANGPMPVKINHVEAGEPGLPVVIR